MTARDIIVIGGSAGAIGVLLEMTRNLPADLPAAVFIVVHVSPGAVSRLPEILSRAGPLPAAHATHHEPIMPGRIYVAPPDRHLLVRGRVVELNRGPRENHARPAIDPLFRSAARAFGPRTIGVILSGALFDGATGLLAVKGRGGTAIVQDPQEAITSSMPRTALSLVEADHVIPARQIGPLLKRLVMESVDGDGGRAMDEEERIAGIISEDFAEQASNERAGEPTVYTCPDCGGILWQTENNAGFFCHIGHAYAAEALLVQKSEELESALWACVRLFHEKATLTRQTAIRTATESDGDLAAHFEEQAEVAERHASVIRQLLEASPNPVEQAALHGIESGVPHDRSM